MNRRKYGTVRSCLVLLILFAIVGCNQPASLDTGADTTTDITLPTPTGLKAIAKSISQIDLTWTASTDKGVTEYKVYISGGKVATVTLPKFNDTDLRASTTYSYQVAACDKAGNCSAKSNVVTARTFSPPDKEAPEIPTGLTATAVSTVSGDQIILGIDLTWDAAADNVDVTAYQVFRDGTEIATPQTRSHSDTGTDLPTGTLVAGTMYTYTVAACDAADNCSLPSLPVSATTHFILNVTVSGTGKVTGTVPPIPPDTEPLVVIDCQTSSTETNKICEKSFAPDTVVSLTAAPVSGFVFSGWSGCTSTGTFTCEVTMSDAQSVTATFNVSPPSEPTGLVAKPGNGQVTLNWTKVTGANSYNLYRSTTTGVTKISGTQIAVGNVLTYTHTGLTNGTTYYFVVTALNAGVEGKESTEANATPQGLGAWATKASIRTARAGLAVGVVDGILYAVGGEALTGLLATVEAYNPVTDAWTTKTPMPTARAQLAVGVVDGILYAVGGEALTGPLATVEAYNPVTDAWTTKTPMPTARAGLAVGVVDGILYAVGGVDSNGEPLATVEAYDPMKNQWCSSDPTLTCGAGMVRPFPMPLGVRAGLAVGVVDGILYAVGGKDSVGIAIAAVERYNPTDNTWTTTKASMLTARAGLAVEIVDSILYAVGGCCGSDGKPLATVEVYDPKDDTWTAKASMPTARAGLAAGVVDGILYTVGGCATAGVPCVDPIATVEAYTPPAGPNANIWVKDKDKAPMPTARSGLAIGVVNGILYAVGGSDSSGSLKTIEAYDPRIDTWTVKASMSTARSDFAVGVVNGILYAVGGCTTGCGTATPTIVATVEAYNPTDNTWTAKAPMLTARSDFAVGVVNGILYAVGGVDSNGFTVSTVEAYDPKDDSWATTTPTPMLTARAGLAVGIVNGILYAVGGVDSNGSTVSTVEAYDPKSDTGPNPNPYPWTAKASMPTARAQLAVGVVNGILYAVGGCTAGCGTAAPTIVATVEAYDPRIDTWTAKAPMPTARAQLAVGVVNGILYAVGGSDSVGKPLTTIEAFTPSRPTTNRAYVVNSGSDTVSVIDTTTNAIVGTPIAVGDSPIGIAVHPAANRAYAVNNGSDTISVIDTANNAVVATVNVGNRPMGVAVHVAINRLYVTNNGSDTVSVIDTTTNKVVATITVGDSPIGIAVDPTANRAYVTNLFSDTVSVIDTTTNTVVATVNVGDSPYGMAVDTVAKRAYVANANSHTISVIDTTTNTVVPTVVNVDNPIGVAVDAVAKRVYVTNYSSGKISVIDTTTDLPTVVATVPVGSSPIGIAVHPAAKRVYVTNQGDDTVSVIDTDATKVTVNTVVTAVPVGDSPNEVRDSPYGVAVAP